MEKKNICITINSLARGGAEKQCLLLAKALKPYHNVTVIIINPKPVYQPHLTVIANENLNHIFLAKNPLRKIVELPRLLKRRKIDIIFSFLPTDTLWAAVCGKLARVPYVFGGIRNSHIAYVKYAALRFANNHFLNYTIANNYSAYDSAMDFGFKNNVLVIPNGIEIRPIQRKENTNSKSVSIISLGRLVKQKDYQTALKAIVALKNSQQKDYHVRYRIIGNGPEQKNITTLIESYDLKQEVELITDPSNIYGLLESADIYLCTSTFEGISNSIMEAMNCALPVVATDAGDNSRLVIDKKNGFLAKIGAYKAIARHLRTLSESAKLRNRMGAQGYMHLKENFSDHKFQEEYLKIINTLEAL